MIGFTGHRNKTIDEKILEDIMLSFPAETWVHGGAIGFDSQVARFARKNNIKQIVVRPDYSNGRAAPLIRNRTIVDMCRIIFACYDGRKSGGTYYTINYAQKSGKQIVIHEPNT